MISVIGIPQLKDNYSYALINDKEMIIVDPAESVTILNFIENKKLSLKAILITHHHSDHTAGVKGILDQIKVPVYSPNTEIEYTTIEARDQETINLDFIKIEVLAAPGHTMDHIIFYNKENNILFSGDTLFRLGCGKVFEGTYELMFNSLEKIKELDDKTNVYCGHEYTDSNLNFLLSIFPLNESLLIEREKISLQLLETGSSIPFNLGKEKELNPFLAPNSKYFNNFKKKNNLSNLELFSYLRDLKNNF